MSNDEDVKGLSIGLGDPDSDPAHARVRAALGETGATLAPAPGWEAKVWARIDAEQPSHRVRWGWFASGAMAAAAAVALLVWQPWRGGAPGGAGDPVQVAMAAPDITIRSGAQQMRSNEAAPGDTLSVKHEVAAVEVWVYFDDQLMHEGGARVELMLERPGTYHVITTVGPRTAPPSLDAALASLVTDGAWHHRREISVR